MDDKKYNAMHDAKLLNMAEGVLLPLIDTMIQEKLWDMTNTIRSNDMNLIAPAAYIAALQDFRLRIQQIQTSGNKLLAKQEVDNGR